MDVASLLLILSPSHESLKVSGSESRELPRVELAKCTTPSESTAQSVEATQESRQVAESLLASKGLTTMASI